MRNKWLQETSFRYFFRAIFFMFVLLIGNHTVFLVQFEINLRLRVFQKAEIALAEVALASYADILWARHAIFLPHVGEEDCVMSPKNVCVGGYEKRWICLRWLNSHYQPS